MEREGRGGARQKLNVDPLNGLQGWQGGENVAIGQADAGRNEIKRLNMLDTDALRSEVCFQCASNGSRSEEHTSELQSLMRISYAVFCLKKKNKKMQKLE